MEIRNPLPPIIRLFQFEFKYNVSIGLDQYKKSVGKKVGSLQSVVLKHINAKLSVRDKCAKKLHKECVSLVSVHQEPPAQMSLRKELQLLHF